MSRERTDTAESSSSFGLRERSGTAGSSEFASMVDARQGHGYRDTASHPSPRGRTSNNTILHRAVEWLQRVPVPKVLLPTVRRLLKWKATTTRTSANPNEPELTDSPGRANDTVVYCVRGLDRVVFGTTAAADCVLLLGVQPPRYLWYMVSGALCDIFQLLVDVTLHLTILTRDDQAALCWMLSFCLSIVARHTSHRYLVFGDYVPNYWQSLGRMYAGYSISIVLSTIFNYVITQGVAKVSHYVAYIFTLLWTGLANYFILKKLWNMGGPAASGGGSAGQDHHSKPSSLSQSSGSHG